MANSRIVTSGSRLLRRGFQLRQVLTRDEEESQLDALYVHRPQIALEDVELAEDR